jgi:hypothetical protein
MIRLFLFTALALSLQGAIMPDGWLQLTEWQRWQGVIILAVINLLYHMFGSPWLHRKMNNR